MSKASHRPKKKISAQAMVEFALALPILLLVIYGLLETGRLIFMYASVVTAARNAARYGSASGDNGSGTHYYDDCAGIIAAANRVAFIQRFSSIDIKYDSGPGTSNMGNGCKVDWTQYAGHPANGDRIRVTVRTDFSPIVPLLPFRAFPIISTDSRTLLIGAHIEVTPDTQYYQGGTQLVLGKSADVSTYSQVGQVVHYTYKIQNVGTSTISGPFTITDDKIGGSFLCGGAPGVLPGGSAIYTCNNPQPYTITLADCNAPSLTNKASAVNGDNTAVSNVASVTIVADCRPKITLAKSGVAPDTVVAGQLVHYTFTITNSGNVPLTPPYTISDPLIGNNWTCPSTPNPLAMGATVTCTGTYALKNSDISTGSVTNRATATAMYGATTVTSAPASAVVLTPELFLALKATPGNVTQVGQTVVFTYSLTNRTTKSMSNIVVTDTRGANQLACLSSLAAGATGTCTNSYIVTRADYDSPTGYFTDIASATAQGNINSNRTGVNVTILQLPGITLTKSADPTLSGPGTFFTAGTIITYTYRVFNSGNVTITPSTTSPLIVTESDPRVVMGATCNVKSGSIAPQTYLTPDCTGTLELTDADIAAGSVTSSGTVNAKFGGTALQANAQYTLITYYDARLSLVKTANKSYFVSIGEQIIYTYAIRNTGGKALTVSGGYTLSDNKLPGTTITCTAAATPVQLQYGSSIACGTGTYTTTGGDVGAGQVVNTVQRATGSTVPVTTPGPTSLTVTLLQCDATHPKTADPGLPIPDGSNSSWSILNNTGTNLHLSGASITWNGGNLTDIFLAGISVWTGSAAPNGTLSVPVTGWPTIPFSLTTPTTMAFKFSANATGIQVSLVFQEAVGGNSCRITSP